MEQIPYQARRGSMPGKPFMLIFRQKTDYKRPEYLFVEQILFEDSPQQALVNLRP